MIATTMEKIKEVYKYVVEVPGIKFKIAELILSLIAYCKTLTHYPFGYLEIFTAQIVVLGTCTVLQTLIIMRFCRVPPRRFERVVVGLYGVLNIIYAVTIALKVHWKKTPDEDMEIIYANLQCTPVNIDNEFHMDTLILCLFSCLLGIIMVFDTLTM